MNAFAHTPIAHAGPQLDNRRMLAAVIDLVLVVVGGLALTKIAGLVTGSEGGITPQTRVLMVAWALYYYFALESGDGQTVGKKLMKLRVVRADGTPVGMREVAVRTVLRVVDGLFVYLVGLIVMLVTGERRQRLGDLAAGTVVADASATAAERATEVAAPPDSPEAAAPAAESAPGYGERANEAPVAEAHTETFAPTQPADTPDFGTPIEGMTPPQPPVPELEAFDPYALIQEPQPEPAAEQPRAEEPAFSPQPAAVERQSEEPAASPQPAEERQVEERQVEESAFSPPAAEEPQPEEPAFPERAEATFSQEPQPEEPVFPEQPSAREPQTDEPVFPEQPAGREPQTEEPVFPEQPAGREPQTEEPVFPEQPSAREPQTDEPALPEQAAGEPQPEEDAGENPEGSPAAPEDAGPESADVSVRSVETVSAIDLVMGEDEDRDGLADGGEARKQQGS